MGPNGAAVRYAEAQEATHKVLAMIDNAFVGGRMRELWIGIHRWERREVGSEEEEGKEGLKIVVDGKMKKGFRAGNWVRLRNRYDDYQAVEEEEEDEEEDDDDDEDEDDEEEDEESKSKET